MKQPSPNGFDDLLKTTIMSHMLLEGTELRLTRLIDFVNTDVVKQRIPFFEISKLLELDRDLQELLITEYYCFSHLKELTFISLNANPIVFGSIYTTIKTHNDKLAAKTKILLANIQKFEENLQTKYQISKV